MHAVRVDSPIIIHVHLHKRWLEREREIAEQYFDCLVELHKDEHNIHIFSHIKEPGTPVFFWLTIPTNGDCVSSRDCAFIMSRRQFLKLLVLFLHTKKLSKCQNSIKIFKINKLIK